MAKSNKKAADRRALVEQMRREQQRKERRQGLLVVGAAVLVGVIIIGIAVWQVLEANEESGSDLSGIGVAADAAGCKPVEKEKPKEEDIDGFENTAHVETGTPVEYRFSPPAFGLHWPNYLQGSELRSFYTVDDRPEVERLVHSLEHGYTILWYDETIADDDEALAEVEAIARKFPDPGSVEEHFIAAPWTAEDGDPMPDGTHLALTHWSIGGEGGSIDDEVGVWQHCEGVSGEAVQQFMDDYPPMDAPEPGAA